MKMTAATSVAADAVGFVSTSTTVCPYYSDTTVMDSCSTVSVLIVSLFTIFLWMAQCSGPLPMLLLFFMLKLLLRCWVFVQ